MDVNPSHTCNYLNERVVDSWSDPPVRLVGGGGPDPKPFIFALGRRAVDTDIRVEADENGVFSKLHINTVDRPGLLVEIVKVLKDINVNVISAEVRSNSTSFAALGRAEVQSLVCRAGQCSLAPCTIRSRLSSRTTVQYSG